MAIKETVDNSTTLSMENKRYYINLTDRIFEILDSPTLSQENRDDLIKMIPLLNKFIEDADIRDKVFLDKQTDKLLDYGVKALVTLAAILGVKFAYTYFQEKL